QEPVRRAQRGAHSRGGRDPARTAQRRAARAARRRLGTEGLTTMRPDLDDILSGVQRLLMNDFIPTLAATTPFLAEQAMYANLMLEYCKKAWPRMHLALAEEHG